VTRKPDPERIAAHNRAYPDGTRQPALLAAHAAPSSYASTPYFSNNAFVFQGGAGKNTARLVVEPLLGTQYLSADDEQHFPDLFLQAELEARLGHGPVEFDLWAQLPAPSDSLTDPSQPWVGAGKVRLGRLRVLSLAGDSACDGMVFSPLNLPAAITPSDDPILAARAAAYDVSRARRNNAM
jgi:catalase